LRQSRFTAGLGGTLEKRMKLEELIIAKAATLNGCSSEEDRVNTAVLFVAHDLHAALEKINSYSDYTAPEGMTRIARDALTPNVKLTGCADSEGVTKK
jgi:hypothetical protein